MDGNWVPLLCYGAEAFWVGRFVAKGRLTVYTDALFWVLLGLPLLTLYYLAFSQTAFPTNWILPAKYAANGLLVALFTHLLVQSTWCLRIMGARPRNSSEGWLKHVIFSRFIILAALPIALLAILGGHLFDKTLTAEAERHIEERAKWIGTQIETFLKEHQRAIHTTAIDLFGQNLPEEEELHNDLNALKSLHPEILTLIVADGAGKIIAASPKSTEDGKPIVDGARTVADREYFREPKATGRPFISDVFQGRGFGKELIVAISVPIRNPTGELHVLEASMNLGALRQEMIRDLRGKELQALIVDHKEHVVAASDELGVRPLDDARGLSLYRAFTTSEQTFRHNQPRPDRRGYETFLASRYHVNSINWTVIVQEPLWKTQKTIVGFYVMTLIGAALSILLVALLARDTAADIAQPLAALAASARKLQENRIVPAVGLDFANAPREIRDLNADLRAAALALGKANSELELMIAERDLSNQKLDEKVRQRTRELESARALAEKANKAKSEFLANMSHELRTPLHAILGMTDILAREIQGPLTPAQAESLRIVEESGRHLLALINDILDLSKIEAGQIALELHPVNVRTLAETSLRLVRDSARKKNIRLECQLDDRLVEFVGDMRRLKQVLVNLLSNAVKFTPEGGCVTLSATSDPKTGRLVYTVTDTGIGIAPEDLSKLFKAFVQIDSVLSRKYEGTGLGLFLVRRLVELHHGTVSVESTLGQGSRFSVSLPLAHAEAPTLPSPALTRPTPNAFVRSPLVLLAEDNTANVRVVQSFLERSGCRVIATGNGREAVELALRRLPAIVLMDVQMPELDGLEATRRISHDPRTKDIPVVCVTAFAMQEDRERCLEAGARGYLSKPFSLPELLETLVRFLPEYTTPNTLDNPGPPPSAPRSPA